MCLETAINIRRDIDMKICKCIIIPRARLTLNPPTPADSRGSASEEELPAARAKKSLQAARARSKKT